jgi:putative hemolysin
LVALYCFFVVASVAVSRSARSRLREISLEKEVNTSLARLVIRQAEQHFIAMQIGAFTSALLAGFSSFGTGRLMSAYIAERYLVTDFTAEISVYTTIVLTVSFAALFFSQIGKAMTLAEPERSLCRVAPLVLLTSRLLTPFVRFLLNGVRGLLAVCRIEAPLERELSVSAEDISEMVEKSSMAGELEDDTRELIQGVFSISDKVVREVMTPRSEIVSVPLDATLSEVLEVFTREGVSRLIVYGDTLDEVQGIVLTKDLLPYVGRTVTDFSLSKVLRPAYFVPNSKKLDDLLEDLRSTAVHFAVVLDEHGGVDGVVTVEDVLEEIVGEIFDEHDRPAEEVGIRKTRSGDIIVSGTLTPHDLHEKAHVNLPEGEYDTIAGFVISVLGRIPKVGEIVEHKGTRIRVESVHNNRITLLRMIKPRSHSTFSQLTIQSSESSTAQKDSNTRGDEQRAPARVSGIR